MRLRATALRGMRDGRREAEPGQPQTRRLMRHPAQPADNPASSAWSPAKSAGWATWWTRT